MNSEKIARLAGVSKSTVSKVINNYPDVSKKTKDRILEIIKKEKYSPNIFARNLSKKKSNIVGLYFHINTSESSKIKISNSLFYSEIISSVVEKSNEFGYQVLIIHNDDENNLENFLLNNVIAGAIIIGNIENKKKILELSNNNKLVFIDYMKENNSNPNIGVVNPDNIKGSYLATKLLITKGHEKILFLSGDNSSFSSNQRKIGYLKAMKEFGMSKYIQIENCEFSEEKAYEKIYNIASKENFTAIFSANDNMAIGTINALKAKGYNVPKDFSVVGFNNILLGKYMTPALTTVNYFIKQVGERAVTQLESMIKGEDGKNVKIDAELVERESVSNLKI